MDGVFFFFFPSCNGNHGTAQVVHMQNAIRAHIRRRSGSKSHPDAFLMPTSAFYSRFEERKKEPLDGISNQCHMILIFG